MSVRGKGHRLLLPLEWGQVYRSTHLKEQNVTAGLAKSKERVLSLLSS
jgi:hypothetical protein